LFVGLAVMQYIASLYYFVDAMISVL